jgi:hypothetical protein
MTHVGEPGTSLPGMRSAIVLDQPPGVSPRFNEPDANAFRLIS